MPGSIFRLWNCHHLCSYSSPFCKEGSDLRGGDLGEHCHLSWPLVYHAQQLLLLASCCVHNDFRLEQPAAFLQDVRNECTLPQFLTLSNAHLAWDSEYLKSLLFFVFFFNLFFRTPVSLFGKLRPGDSLFYITRWRAESGANLVSCFQVHCKQDPTLGNVRCPMYALGPSNLIHLQPMPHSIVKLQKCWFETESFNSALYSEYY